MKTSIKDVPCLSCQVGYTTMHECDSTEYCPCLRTALHPPEQRYENYGTHTSHCCPLHGCKYGDDYHWHTADLVRREGGCPIADGVAAPDYPGNNGCETCEFIKEKHTESLADLNISKVYAIAHKRNSLVTGPLRFSSAESAQEYIDKLHYRHNYKVVTQYASPWEDA